MGLRRWFPLALQEQAAFYRNFTRLFVEIADSLGFSAEDVAAQEADNAVMQYLAQTDLLVKAFKKSFEALRDGLRQGKGGAMPSYVQFSPLTPPPMVAFGMFDRLFNLADRIVAAKGYNKSIGERLGIVNGTGERAKLSEMELKLKVQAIGDGFAEIRFTRLTGSGAVFYFRYADDEKWYELGRFVKSPARVKIPSRDGKPELIYIRGKRLEGNNPIGVFSPHYSLTVTP